MFHLYSKHIARSLRIDAQGQACSGCYRLQTLSALLGKGRFGSKRNGDVVMLCVDLRNRVHVRTGKDSMDWGSAK